MLERIFGLLGSKGDKPTEVELLTEFLRSINEREGIKEIKAALGGEDGDLDILAEALIKSGVVPPPGVKISRIRVKEVPVGPAPVKVRRSWVGTEMLAVKLPSESGEELDFVTNESMPARDAYAVLSQPAVNALRERSPKAAEWFDQNLPNDLPVLTFGVNEVEIVASTSR